MDDTSLLAPISADAPCGPDLEYDPAFLALESNLDNAFVERAVGPGAEEAAGPDWKRIAAQASELMQRTHDLRVAVSLTKAWLNMQGVTGLARGLSLLQQLLSLRWGSVHPQIGAQGDTDGLMRVNALRSLCDSRSLLSPLRSAPLLRARGLPALCLRDLEQAARKGNGNGEAHSGHGGHTANDGPDATVIDASFIGCDLDELSAMHETVNTARTAARSLEQLFAEHSTPAVLRLSELIAQLDAIDSQLAPRLRARRAALASNEEPQPTAAEASAPAARSALRTSGNGHRNAVQDREDALRDLDRICAYWEEHEPASPVPMLLRRAQRLAGMSFIELVRELAPSGISEIETLRGPNPAESES
jgi:type VI secretion system protein ImpA